MKVSFTRISGNKKTGAIPVTVSSNDTCPQSCPFKEKGCYAKSGPLAIHWRAVSEGRRGSEWNELLKSIKNLPKNKLWRHNVAGDLPHHDGVINRKLVLDLAKANKGKKGFTYTHHTLSAENIETLQLSKSFGFVINISASSDDEADQVMTQYKLPAVCVVQSTENRKSWKTENGRKVLKCPATVADHMTCEKCGLCSHGDRDYIIAFPAHGTAKKAVNQIVK